MRSPACVCLLFALAFLLASPAHTLGCRDWDRMSAGQKSETIERMIQSAVSGSGGRQMHLDRGEVGRCLERHARSIAYDFDGACSDSRTAGMRALDRIFKEYIWTCAG